MEKENVLNGYYGSKEFILSITKRENLFLKIDDDDMEGFYLVSHTGGVPLSMRIPYFIGADSIVEALLIEPTDEIEKIDDLHILTGRLVYYKDKMKEKGYEGRSFIDENFGFEYLISVPGISELEKVLKDFGFLEI